MDKNNNTLGGFETILDGIMPTDPSKAPITGGFDGGEEELSDEEIEALKGKRAPSVNEVKGIKNSKKTVEVEDDDDDEEEEEDIKPEPTKKTKVKEVEEEVEE